MKSSAPGFPTLTARQKSLLEEIESLKEELKTLPPWDPKTGTWPHEFYEIQKRIDDLSVKALRSGLLRGFPAESRRQGFRLVFDPNGEVAKLLPGFGDFHPELPPWAESHFIEWIQMLPLRRHDARETLREIGIVSIETGMKRPIDFADIERWALIRRRVLELRGAEMQEKLRKGTVVTDEMLKIAKEECKDLTDTKRKRTRKNSATWDWVIEKLVEEGLLTKKISQQAFKKMLKGRWPDYPWHKA